MLPGMMIPLGAANQVGSAAISFLQQGEDAVNRTSYTFSSQSLGAADATRRIVVAASGGGFGSTPTIFSVQIAGVTAIPVVSSSVYYSGGLLGLTCGLYIASIPAGTTGNVVVTFNTQIYHCGYAAWRLTNLSTSTAYDTASDNSGSGSVDVNVANGGVIVAAGMVYPDTTNSWAGVTERFDSNIESNRTFTGGDHTATATEAPRTVTVTSTSSAETIVAASWV